MMRLCYLVLVVTFGVFVSGIGVQPEKNLIKDKEERSFTSLTDKNKRGILPLGEKRYGSDYDSGRYGPPPYEDHRPYYEDDGYRPSDYGYGRPSGYDYGPPRIPEYYHEAGYNDHNGPGDGGYNKGLTLKKILLPLAGLAILGAVAAASQNPVLLQLGTVNGRKRRSLSSDFYPANPYVKPDH